MPLLRPAQPSHRIRSISVCTAGDGDGPVRNVTTEDWDAINARRTPWHTRWNRQIER
ncbi:hypothetical protein IHE33_06475 [Mycetohabitans endofungorum]